MCSDSSVKRGHSASLRWQWQAPPQPRQSPAALIPSVSDIRQKHPPVNCWQRARAVSRAAHCSAQTLPAGSFSSHTKLFARETEIQRQQHCLAQKDTVLSRFPCIPRNLQAPIHTSLEFLESVRCSAHKWPQWVQGWQNECTVSIRHTNFVNF